MPGGGKPAVTARFRDNLTVRESETPGGRVFLVEDPDTLESFSFGEEEYFLCRLMDGRLTAAEIISRFQEKFGMEMSGEHFRNFEEHLLATGLAQRVELEPSETEIPESKSPPPAAAKSINKTWELFNPEHIFVVLTRLTRPFDLLVTLSLWALIPCVPMALFLFFRHNSEFRVDLNAISGELGYLGGLLFGLIAANFVRCVIQGVVLTRYGLVPQAFGIKLRRGIMPRFYIEKSRARGMGRSAKLWIYGTSILVRLYFIAGGMLVWMLFKDGSSVIPSVAVLMVQTGVIGLVLQLLPIETSDGYRWLVTYFNLPPTMLFIAAKVLSMRLTGRPLPASLSGWTGTRYLIYGILLVVVLVYASIELIERLSAGLFQTAPDILGRATPYIFLAVVGFFVLRWAWSRIMHKPAGKTQQVFDDEDWEGVTFDKEGEAEKDAGGWAELFRRHRGWVIFLGVLIVLCIPFAYRPGGEIQVLPPVQQMIQAPVSGKIAEVRFEGGDGKLIPQGEVVARMISSEIENDLLTLEQSRSQQLATIDKLKSELAKLQSGARSEEITGAEAKLQQTVEQMSVAEQELESTKVSASYSAMILPRMEKLYKSGSLALMQLEEARKTAQIDRINVEKATKNLASLAQTRDEALSQLNLLKSGARQEDIDAARHSIEAGQAELSRIEQQVVYAKQQQTEAALLMPFEGYLVDSHLDFKKGTYLKQGEMYATAQNNSQPLVEVQLPEYDMEGVEVGAAAQVRLFAYPNSTLYGKVLSIQPAAAPSSTTSPEATTRLFRVLIEVEKPPFTLKAGMTGFAKINAGYQPLGLLLARPIIRFVQIEMWSWLP